MEGSQVSVLDSPVLDFLLTLDFCRACPTCTSCRPRAWRSTPWTDRQMLVTSRPIGNCTEIRGEIIFWRIKLLYESVPLWRSQYNCYEKLFSTELVLISQMQRKNMWLPVPVWRDLRTSPWAKQFRLFPLYRSASQNTHTNSSFSSVSALALARNKSEYDDNAIKLCNKFPPFSENFRHLSYRLRKHFHLISIRFTHMSAKKS